jgi:polyhydroxybutyrate depolymerase
MRLLPWFVFAAALVACSSSSSPSGSGSGHDGGAGDDGGGGGGDDGGGGTDAKPTPTPDVKTTTEDYEFNGNARKYILSLPVDYSTAKKYPLVLELHGNPGTAEFMRDVYPFAAVSKRDAIVVYPNALGTDWDLFSQDNPDMGFVRSLTDALAAKYSIDRQRVFGVGWSGGAFFVNQLACRYSGLFRAIASHAGGAPLDVEPGNPSTYAKCTGGPMAIFITHGTSDGTVDFGSGVSDAVVWASINGCQSGKTDATPPPCQKNVGCPASAPVVFCPVEGGTHALWSQALQGSWDFFKSL